MGDNPYKEGMEDTRLDNEKKSHCRMNFEDNN